MTGIYQHTLDAKGRLFIPAKLREELGDTFYVTVSPEKCLSAYSQENWKAISEKAAAMTNLQQRKVRPLFAYAARCDLDGQGRILLPQHLREFAGLTKSVTVVGSNNHAEFWDSARCSAAMRKRSCWTSPLPAWTPSLSRTPSPSQNGWRGSAPRSSSPMTAPPPTCSAGR